MPPKTKFHEGEKVLCFHGPLLYEAKCVKVDVKDKQTRYYIHYNGWNKNWDEWVPESRVLKHNEAGLQKQKELMSAHGVGAVKKASKGGRKSEKKEAEKKEEKERTEKEEKEKEKEKKGSGSSQAASKKKEEKASPAASLRSRLSASAATRGRTSAAASLACDPERRRTRSSAAKIETDETQANGQEEGFIRHIEVRIKMPEELKPWLVDDWDLITRQEMLVNLPCRNTVDNIVDDFVKIKTAQNNVNKDAVIETMAGVKDYFNVMLGTQLLYKFERPQYNEILAENPGKPMSSLYGATHLLRLFVRLGQMLDYTPLDENCVQILLTNVHDFLKYMLENAASLFSYADYSTAPPAYHRKVI